MCRRNSGQSRRKRRICSRILVCSPALRSTTIEEGTVIPPTTRDKLALSGVADRNCRCHSLLQCVRPITWFDLVDRGVEDKRLLFSQGEFYGALQGMKRQGNTLSSQLRLAWDANAKLS